MEHNEISPICIDTRALTDLFLNIHEAIEYSHGYAEKYRNDKSSKGLAEFEFDILTEKINKILLSALGCIPDTLATFYSNFFKTTRRKAG